MRDHAASQNGLQPGTRASALWGTGGRRGEGSRSSVLWGKGGRNTVAGVVLAMCALFVPFAATSASNPPPPAAGSGSTSVYIPSSLLSQAQASGHDTFNVIVQGDGSNDADHVARQVAQFAAQASHQLQDNANKADHDLSDAQQKATDAAQKAAQAQTQAQAAAAKAAATGKKGDQDAATKAAQNSANTQQATTASQAALAQAQTADTKAHAGVGQLAAQILQQQITSEFSSITGVAATLTGDQIANLVQHSSGLLSITPNAPTETAGPTPPVNYSSTQLWPYESHSSQNWGPDKDANFVKNIPSIAIVDSGIQTGRADFGNRLIGEVNLSTLSTGQGSNDDNGHGTFVAGIAADGLSGITGANPGANLVDVKVMDSNGTGLTSDIINACQWILTNASKYNIKVANFSLHSDITAPFYIDPLDRAVEQLWFSGITVVVASGNYGNTDGSPSGVVYSPSDDPFVITVGAADTDGSVDPKKATMAPWSAYGYTPDGFFKPEVSAPGRYMIGPVPANATLPTERPGNVTSPGYIQLSGTSFAAPVVSGTAANILAAHPTWSPDQVKGALMLTAKAGNKLGDGGGVGVIQGDQSVHANNPPNPNLGLDAFIKSSGGSSGTSYSFDGASWNSAAQGSASWNSASWNSASWNSASWNSASWNSVSWNSASWNSASWNSASWNSASWNSASWNSASKEDAAEGDATADQSQITLDSTAVAALLADPDFDPTTLPPGAIPPGPPTPSTTTVSTLTGTLTH